MPARSALAQYVLDRILERHETPEEFAARVGINASGLYKFLRGAYAEPRQTTLDKIAAGLNMTPAELLVVTGKGNAEHDPDEAELLSYYRSAPAEKKSNIKEYAQLLAVQPIVPKPPRRRSQSRSDALDRHNDDETRRVRSHLGIANLLSRGSRQVVLRGESVAA